MPPAAQPFFFSFPTLHTNSLLFPFLARLSHLAAAAALSPRILLFSDLLFFRARGRRKGAKREKGGREARANPVAGLSHSQSIMHLINARQSQKALCCLSEVAVQKQNKTDRAKKDRKKTGKEKRDEFSHFFLPSSV